MVIAVKLCLQDIAVLTGGQVISEDLGYEARISVTMDMLGTAKKVAITKDETTIIDGAGEKAEIQHVLHKLSSKIAETTSDYDKEKLQERVAKLAGGVAVFVLAALQKQKLKNVKIVLMMRLMQHVRLFKKVLLLVVVLLLFKLLKP